MKIEVLFSGEGVEAERRDAYSERLLDEIRAHYPEARVHVAHDASILGRRQEVRIHDFDEDRTADAQNRVHEICAQVLQSGLW